MKRSGLCLVSAGILAVMAVLVNAPVILAEMVALVDGPCEQKAEGSCWCNDQGNGIFEYCGTKLKKGVCTEQDPNKKCKEGTKTCQGPVMICIDANCTKNADGQPPFDQHPTRTCSVTVSDCTDVTPTTEDPPGGEW